MSLLLSLCAPEQAPETTGVHDPEGWHVTEALPP
jgi:hypothetical protein